MMKYWWSFQDQSLSYKDDKKGPVTIRTKEEVMVSHTVWIPEFFSGICLVGDIIVSVDKHSL